MQSMSVSKKTDFQNIAALVLAVSMTSLMMASSASASGRCGGVYSVDSATTLTTVARRCNVNLSALYEANPGVDPSHIVPGERLSIPSEIDRYTTTKSYAQQDDADDHETTTSASHDAVVSRDYDVRRTDDDGFANIYNDHQYDDARDDNRENFARGQIRIRDTRVSAESPLWLQPETGGGARYRVNDRLSFQKLSANRIHNAGNSFSVPSILNTGSVVTTVSVTDAAATRFIECPVLRASNGSKIHQVRKIISTPDTTFVEIKDNPEGQGFDCTLLTGAAFDTVKDGASSPHVLPAKFTSPKLAPPAYNLPDYSRIGAAPRVIRINESFSLSGKVTDSYAGCLLLVTDENRLWRLASDQPSAELIGKKVTVWGTAGTNNTCGGGASMKVSHAVYADPWTN